MMFLFTLFLHFQKLVVQLFQFPAGFSRLSISFCQFSWTDPMLTSQSVEEIGSGLKWISTPFPHLHHETCHKVSPCWYNKLFHLKSSVIFGNEKRKRLDTTHKSDISEKLDEGAITYGVSTFVTQYANKKPHSCCGISCAFRLTIIKSA